MKPTAKAATAEQENGFEKTKQTNAKKWKANVY